MGTTTRLNGVAQIFASLVGFIEFIVRVAFVLILFFSFIGAIFLMLCLEDGSEFISLLTPYLWRLL